MNIVQILDSKRKRRVGLVNGGSIILLKRVARTTELAKQAAAEKKDAVFAVGGDGDQRSIDAVHAGS